MKVGATTSKNRIQKWEFVKFLLVFERLGDLVVSEGKLSVMHSLSLWVDKILVKIC